MHVCAYMSEAGVISVWPLTCCDWQAKSSRPASLSCSCLLFLPSVSWLIACQWDMVGEGGWRCLCTSETGREWQCVWVCVCEGVFSSSRGSQRKTESRRLKNNDPYSRGAVCVFDYVCASELMFACVCVSVSSERVSGNYLVRLWPLTPLSDLPHPVQPREKMDPHSYICTPAHSSDTQTHTCWVLGGLCELKVNFKVWWFFFLPLWGFLGQTNMTYQGICAKLIKYASEVITHATQKMELTFSFNTAVHVLISMLDIPVCV